MREYFYGCVNDLRVVFRSLFPIQGIYQKIKHGCACTLYICSVAHYVVLQPIGSSVRTHNTAVVGSNPVRFTIKTISARSGNGYQLTKRTCLDSTQRPVFGSWYACNGVQKAMSVRMTTTNSCRKSASLRNSRTSMPLSSSTLQKGFAMQSILHN